MDPQKRVDALMSDLPQPKPRGIVAQNEDLALAIKYTLEKIRMGDLPMGFKAFYNAKLKDEFDGPHYETVRQYVHDVLKFNTLTGEAL